MMSHDLLLKLESEGMTNDSFFLLVEIPHRP